VTAAVYSGGAGLAAPFPWFGGKSRAAHAIWQRFGDPPNYVEPFAGSLAVLLARPDGGRRVETVNDKDAFVSNFWRAVTADPEGTARYADWPVNENDLHARHAYLVGIRDGFRARIEGDPDFFDPRVAGWWAWGVCNWIGSGFCSGAGPWTVRDGELVRDPGHAGAGVKRQLPHLWRARGINRTAAPLGDVYAWFAALADRLRTVRVTSGDWTRVLSETVTTRRGVTGILLDPPYSSAVDQWRVYASDDLLIAHAVRDWAAVNGGHPLMRIALCGYAGEGHEALEDAGWTVHRLKAQGGYGAGRDNTSREAVWFSPHCLPVTPQPSLFGAAS